MIDATEHSPTKADGATPAAVNTARERKAHSYVLMTAAHNEEADIERTIQSVLAQTIRPTRWLIASDNSTDRTNEIVQRYADQHDFICFHQVVRAPGRDFASKVAALRSGEHLLQGVSYDFIGNMDADLAVEPDYFEGLIRQFDLRPRLGVAGGFVHERANGNGPFESRVVNQVYSVSHAAQLVRRELYEAFGGYAVLRYGGEDWHAQTSARMLGWEAESIPELKIFHYRRTGSAGGMCRSDYRLGKLDYSFGTYPLFELIKCGGRIFNPALLVGGVIRMVGFLDSYFRREPFLISPELVAYLRKEQKDRMFSMFRRSAVESKP